MAIMGNPQTGAVQGELAFGPTPAEVERPLDGVPPEELGGLGIVDVDPHTGRIIRVNRRYAEITGYSEAELLGLTVSDLTHPDDFARDRLRFEEYLRGGAATYETEKRYVRKDGAVIWVAVRATLVRDAQGRVVSSFGVATDITARKEAEQAREESEESFRAMFELAGVGMTKVDAATGRFVRVNRHICELTGYSEQELLQRTIVDLTHPDDVASDLAKTEPYFRGEADTYETEKRYVRKDGSVIWVGINGRLLRDGQGRPVYSLGVVQDITARKEAEQAREESEADFRAMFEQAAVGMVQVDFSTGHYVRVNRRFCEITGYAPEELARMTRVDLDHPEDHMVEKARVAPYLNGETDTYETEKRYVRKDGGIAWVRISARLLRDKQGSPYRTLGVVQDITAEKRAAQDLRESEARARRSLAELEATYYTAPVGLCVIDEDLRFVRINERLAEINGVPAESHIGRSVREIVPDVADLLEPVLRGIFVTGDPVLNLEVIGETAARPGIQRIWVEHLFPLFDDAGHVVAVSEVAEEVTERRRAEKALRESEERLRLAQQAASVGTWDLDLVTGNATWSDAIWEFTGLQPGTFEPSFNQWMEIIHPEDRDRVITNVQAAVSGGEHLEDEFRLVRSDGRVVWIASRGRVYRDACGNPVRMVGVNMDVSERKGAEAALRAARDEAEEANRMKSVFLANMSHEIRTPLTGILGFASLLRTTTEGKARSYAERIERSGKRLTDTLNAVLTLARLEAGRAVMALESLDVPLEVLEVTDMFRPEAVAKGLSYSVAIAEEARGARAMLDRGAFTSVLQNLVSNAIKFTDEGGVHVLVGLAADGEGRGDGSGPPRRIVVRVEDSGIGIGSEFLPRLFEPFMQESEGLSRTYEGTGLGLSIARQLAEKMGGAICVESEKGAGTRFTLTFPLAALSESPVVGVVRDTSGKGNGTRRRVLVVDDHEDTRVLTDALLRDHYDVTLSSTAEEAMETARQASASGRPFDVVLLDINLGPGRNGQTLLKRLRQTPEYAAVPVAAMTANALPGDQERFLKSGFDAYLSKPFRPDDLRALLARLLNRPAPRPAPLFAVPGASRADA